MSHRNTAMALKFHRSYETIVLEHNPFFGREEFLLLGKHVDNPHLVAHIVALVLWIGDHVGHGGMGNFIAVVIAVALVPEDSFDLFHAVLPGGIQIE